MQICTEVSPAHLHPERTADTTLVELFAIANIPVLADKPSLWYWGKVKQTPRAEAREYAMAIDHCLSLGSIPSVPLPWQVDQRLTQANQGHLWMRKAQGCVVSLYVFWTDTRCWIGGVISRSKLCCLRLDKTAYASSSID